MRGPQAEVFRHPYMVLLRQMLLDLLPRPAGVAQLAAGGSPTKSEERGEGGGAAFLGNGPTHGALRWLSSVLVAARTLRQAAALHLGTRMLSAPRPPQLCKSVPAAA